MPKYLLTLLKFTCPLLTVLLPCLVVVGMLWPWPVAQRALGVHWTSGAMLIGWSYKYQGSGENVYERREQTYALLPTPKTITVIQENGNVRAVEDSYGGIPALISYGLLLLGTWWFWFRPKRVQD